MNALHEKRQAQRQAATRKLGMWTAAWVISQAIVVFGGSLAWPELTSLKLLSIGLNIALGLMMIGANRNLIKTMDELERQQQLESMGITLGLTLVIGLAYSSLHIIKLMPFDAEISYLVMFMGITYLVTLAINKKRFQ